MTEAQREAASHCGKCHRPLPMPEAEVCRDCLRKKWRRKPYRLFARRRNLIEGRRP